MSTPDHISEERISFREVIERISRFIRHLLGLWKKIVIASLVLAALYVTLKQIADPVYTAETTFVLEGTNSQLAQVSSLASSIGLNIGGLSGDEGLFQTDNIVQLYVSRRMLRETFLSSVSIEDKEERLITRLAREQKLDKHWQSKIEENFSFEIAIDELSVTHDSVLFEVIEKFRENNLRVDKLDRKLSILSVQVYHKDQLFAKRFNEVLVEKVNQFYRETKTKKSGDNLAILQSQADSAKKVLELALDRLATETESTPNPNPLYHTFRSDIQKARIEVETAAAVYEELVKSLEIARITHLNNMPLIQIIDVPLLPLENDKDSLLKSIFKGGLISGILVVLYFAIMYVYREALRIN